MLIYFLFYYIFVPYFAVISPAVFSCLNKRETVGTIEDTNRNDCPLTKSWTWLTFSSLLVTGVLWVRQMDLNMADLLSSSYIIVPAYLFTLLILTACVVFLVALRFISGGAKTSKSRLLRCSTLNVLAVVAVLAMLFGSKFIAEFAGRAFVITH